MFGQERGGGLRRRRGGGQALLALCAGIQGVDVGDGALDPLKHMLLLAGGKGERTHHQASLQPVLPLLGLILAAWFKGVGKADRHRIVRLGNLTVGVRQAHVQRCDLAAED